MFPEIGELLHHQQQPGVAVDDRITDHRLMILLDIGDLAQIDNPYVYAHTNGLVFTRNRLQGQPFMAHVNLFKGERSEMADVAANLM